jgi:trimethylamine--corrinoid protein Co-methyltransferase
MMDAWNLRGGQLRFLTDKQIEEIHFAALDVLQRVGCFFEHEDALRIFEEAGAWVDREKRIIHIPHHLVDQALRNTPDRVFLAARNPKYDIFLEDDRVYFGTGTVSVNVLDLETGKLRRGNRKDCEDFPRLVNALEYVHFFKSMIFPSDVNQKIPELYQVYSAFANTEKQISSNAYSANGAKDMIRMGEIIAGGMKEFRKRPMIIINVLAVSPLQWSHTNLEILIDLAKLRVPIIIGSEPQAGTTGPVTLAGEIVLNTAETLAGITLAQIISPGIPIVYGHIGSISDMRSGLFASGAVELSILNAMSNQMAHYYRLPTYATGGMSDAKLSDYQAGTEKALQALITAMSGGNYIHDAAGLLECCLTSSYEQYVLDNEMLAMVARALHGVNFSRETLAFEVIQAIGPRGNFLGHMHTLQNITKEHFIPKIFNRQVREDWEKGGSKSAVEVAREEAKRILRTHQPTPLPPEVDRELQRIIKKAEESYGR